MSKVIIFSRFFPSYHPRKGEETFFVEKLWNSFREYDYSLPISFIHYTFDYYKYMPAERYFKGMDIREVKEHTIRAGNRWKAGDKFSPRVWSGKPYRSKQIIIAPDIEIKKVFQFEFLPALWLDESEIKINGKYIGSETYSELVTNDGLTPTDFIEWFGGGNLADTNRKKFIGQIICWNERIDYTEPPPKAEKVKECDATMLNNEPMPGQKQI